MKKFILFNIFTVLLLIIQSSVSAQISVVGYVQTSGSGDTYPTHIDSLQKGGYRIAKDRTERNAIPAMRRKAGMLVYEQSTDSTFILKGGTANTNWVAYTTGSTATGTLTSVALTASNGINGSVTNATTTPSINLSLGNITPTSVASLGTVSGTTANFSGLNLTGPVSGTTANFSGLNLTGPVSGTTANFSGLNLTGPVSGTTANFSGLNVTGNVSGIAANFGSITSASSISGSIGTFDKINVTNNGNGTNIYVGDDAVIGDINTTNTFSIRGQQNAANGYLVFGNANNTALGRSGTGQLTYGGSPLWHAGNLSKLSQLTNDVNFITNNSSATFQNITAGNGTFDKVYATNNGNGTNFYVGDDVVLGDINQVNTMSLRGRQNVNQGYISFGNADNTSLGRTGNGPLTYGGGVRFDGSIDPGYRFIPGIIDDVHMLWIPQKGSFFAGSIPYNAGNLYSIGGYSSVFGIDNFSSGWNTATFGNSNNNYGSSSAAFGYDNIISGSNSIVFGTNNNVSGSEALAFGTNSRASGNRSFAQGDNAIASGTNTIALGNHVTASAANSVALGSYVTTGLGAGSFFFGDASSTVQRNGFNSNSMNMRFANGYYLWTNSITTTGSYMNPNDNFWRNMSDSNKKENFVPANGEYFLKSIAAMKLSSWNYKGQDPKTLRHYGPMAQDLFAAFGKDKFGIIGNDTSINHADFGGINLIAIQALEKRTAEQAAELKQLKSDKSEAMAAIEALKTEMVELKKELKNIKQPVSKK